MTSKFWRGGRFFAACLSIGYLCGLGASPLAADDPDMPSIMIDLGSGKVLEETQAHRRWRPASLTKVMTIYMTFAEIEAGRLALDEVLTVSEAAANQPTISLGLAVGQKITVEEAIKATIVRSANDAAALLAERIAGNEAAFAAAMTAKARELGMTRTVFRNATGLPDDQQVTTAHDLALLARAVIWDFPKLYPYFATTAIEWGGETLGTFNPMLGSFNGADGLKTGFTCASGYNLIGSALREGRRVVGVVLGGRSTAERNAHMIELMELAFADGAAADAPTLDEMAVAGQEEPPPHILGAAECSTAPGIAGGGRKIPGWAAIFGFYPDKASAQQAIQQARTQLAGVLTRGQPAVVQRQTEGVLGYAALIVGLKQEEAGAACKAMWGAGGYCLALSPEVLANPNALWR